MAVDAAVELAGDAADGLLVADVGGAQPAGGQSAEVPARLDQHDALPIRAAWTAAATPPDVPP